MSPDSVRVGTSCCGNPVFVLRGQCFSLSPTLVWQIIPSSATFKPFSRWAAIRNKQEGVSTSQTGGWDAPSRLRSFYWAHLGSTPIQAGRKTAYSLLNSIFSWFPAIFTGKLVKMIPPFAIHPHQHQTPANSGSLCLDATVWNGCDECQIAESRPEVWLCLSWRIKALVILIGAPSLR